MKAQNSIERERVVILLRASSKQQTDREHDFDIPQQKSILLPFVDSQGWELVKIFTEGGVSGFKVSANNRDAIQDIKRMADNREFDRLVINMSDRLGRIADKTPLSAVVNAIKRYMAMLNTEDVSISYVERLDREIEFITRRIVTIERETK